MKSLNKSLINLFNGRSVGYMYKNVAVLNAAPLIGCVLGLWGGYAGIYDYQAYDFSVALQNTLYGVNYVIINAYFNGDKVLPIL